MRRLLVIGTGAPALFAIVLVGLGVTNFWAEPEPVDEWARFGHATAVDGLMIVVERGSDRLRPGRETTYTIAVGNRQFSARPVTVQATVPPWLGLIATPAGATVGDGFVDWQVTVPPGAVTTVQLSGAYGAAGPDGSPDWVTFTACVLDPAEARPIVCATDSAALAGSGPGPVGWLVAGGAVLAGTGGLVGWAAWRRRIASI